ncbi:tetratricopeptide repeat protein [Prosthecobacter sp.]|uniref:tetratricopeptide repeat protein n=1 Tax=Prosthecobacter sp. TaxID=1965333 RepID=UPI00248A5AF3|nr:tetratricopeptide repeat protein [Prosthecobacter sp.]MDI1315579.1 tetratricopeptide repeat protein [Prosthecobacter sp.]
MSQLDSTSQELPATGMEKFMEDNSRKLVWLFIIAVVALCAYAFLQHQNTLKANEAAEAFTGAKTVEDCDLVISRYPGTMAAANALLLKADLLWDQNKKSSAVEALKEFTTKDASNPLAVFALLGLGTKLDAMGESKEAQAIFERITSEFSSSEAAPLAQVRLGDLLWAQGKADEAKKAYEEIAVKFPDMPGFQVIGQNRLDWITATLPTKEVDAPPAPKVESKPAAAVPGMPNFKLNVGDGAVGATLLPSGSPAATPAMTTPATTPAPAATAPPAPVTPSVTPAPAASKPATAPAPATPPAAPVPTAPAPATPPATPAPAATTPAAAPAPVSPPAAPTPEAPKP